MQNIYKKIIKIVKIKLHEKFFQMYNVFSKDAKLFNQMMVNVNVDFKILLISMNQNQLDANITVNCF